MTALTSILDLARWAPSGDNTQPWRFAMEAPDRVTVLGHDTRTHCVYDLDGHPSQISIGALLETIRLAATRFGLLGEAARRPHGSDEHPIFDVAFIARAGVREDPLVRFITERRVHRRMLRTRSLTEDEVRALTLAVGPDHDIAWFDGWRGRARVATLNFRNAKLRLTLPEAYPVHRDTIDWHATFSEDRIPAAAIGASAPSLAVMRFAMQSWGRIAFLNRYLGGTIGPRIELDLLPGLACAAHCALIGPRAPTSIDDYVAAGRALQRFWLTATSLGLQFQPGYTPLVFARYAREGRTFTAEAALSMMARRIADDVEKVLGADRASRAVFMGRIGAGEPARARSLRLPLERLLVRP